MCNIFFRPNGVAVIGTSRDPQKLGHGVLRNLIEYRYTGPIYPINRHVDEILGYKTYPSIKLVPQPCELAVIVVPAPYVETALEECGERGIQGAIVVSGGFREAGPEGIEREEAVKRVAEKYGILLLGPNCIGSIDTHTPLNTTFVTGMPRPGEIGFVSQSGAVAAAIIDWARGSGVGLSRIVSLGNQAGITEAMLLTEVASDPYTKVVATYIEGVSNGQNFVEATSAIAQRIPVIALKVGRGEGAATAVASHTGALAGDEASYDAAFRRAGIQRAHTLEEVFDWARALAWQPLPKGNRVAILTNAGGAGVLALDSLEEAGMQLAPLTDQTREYLRRRVFAAASVSNPVDILAGSGPATYAVCLDALLEDETVDAVVVLQAPQDWFEPISLAEIVGEVANSPLGRSKPILTVIMGLASTSEAMQVLHRRHVPNFAYPERVGSTLGTMWQRRQWLDALNENEVPPTIQVETETLAKMMDQAEEGWLPIQATDVLFRTYGIAIPAGGIVSTSEEATVLADELGYPVALKAVGITHKSDVGGVLVGLKSPEELQHGVERLTNKVGVDQFHVQAMVEDGLELIVGVVRDPQFGPLVMAGTGGTTVELTRDVVFELAPLTTKQADSMLDRSTAGILLDGFRGRPPSDREAVINVILALAQMVIDWPHISEIEVNPLIVLQQGAVAVDTRVKLSQQTVI